jgi:hypothetical protein
VNHALQHEVVADAPFKTNFDGPSSLKAGLGDVVLAGQPDLSDLWVELSDGRKGGIRLKAEKKEPGAVKIDRRAAEMEVDKAKRSYTIAYETGDSDKLLEAQQELFRAELKLDKAKNYQPTVQPPQNSVQTPQKQPQAVQMDPKVSTWVTKNQWYVDPSKKAMSSFARGIHEELEDRYGKAFVGTDEYFKSIDKEVQRRFPEEFGGESNNDEAKPQRTKPSTVVAPAMRSTASNKIRLKTSQVQLAKKLGITPEQYALAVRKLEN